MPSIAERIVASQRVSALSRKLYRTPGYAAVVRAVGRRLLTSRPRVVAARAGYRVWVDSGTYEYVVPYIREEHEPYLTSLLRSLLSEGDVFVDVGANIGHFTLVASSAVGPRGRVIACEPDPDVMHALERNVAVAATDNVELHNIAIGDALGEVTLYRTGVGGGMNSVYDAPLGETRGTLQVPMASLDAVVAGRPVTGVKVDVEGAEQKVLAGMDALLAVNPAIWLMIEWRPWFLERWIGVAGGAILDDLWTRDLRTYLVDEEGEKLIRIADHHHGLDPDVNYNLLCLGPAATIPVGQ